MHKPILLCIMDGFGISENSKKENAIKAAYTPNIDNFYKSYPHSTLLCSGLSVGLPEGQMGNSEVGHTNIGAGRVVYQDLTRITKAIEDESFLKNEAFVKAIQNVKINNSSLHLMGLLSNGGVHSHISHLYALLELAARNEVKEVYIHCILDGRDVSPTSGATFIEELENKIAELKVGKISSVIGRYYAMDRDNRYERVQIAYDCLANSDGTLASDISKEVKFFYTQKDNFGKFITDEFMIPIIGDPNGQIKDNDSVIFFNFRPDRAREITRAFVDEDFSGFSRKLLNTTFVCMTEYDATIKNISVAFGSEKLKNTLGEYLSSHGLSQLRIAETEKYAHVTFFFNGGVETVYKGEDRILVPSPKVATYDLKPEMSAYEVTENVLNAISSEKYDVIILNYANCDMVGHTGIFDAAVKAVETVDECVGKVWKSVSEKNGVMLLTADHGNADKMDDASGNVFTAHSNAPVPIVILGSGDWKLRNDGRLCDISPTILDIMCLDKPTEMTGCSLLV